MLLIPGNLARQQSHFETACGTRTKDKTQSLIYYKACLCVVRKRFVHSTILLHLKTT